MKRFAFLLSALACAGSVSADPGLPEPTVLSVGMKIPVMRKPITADVNGDGIEDLVFTPPSNFGSYVRFVGGAGLKNGDLGSLTFSGGGFGGAILTTFNDINGDGRREILAFANSNYTAHAFSVKDVNGVDKIQHQFKFLDENGNGNFGVAVNKIINIGDIDGNGLDEFMVRSNYPTRRWTLATIPGKIQLSKNLITFPISKVELEGSKGGTGGLARIEDFTGDGHVEVLYGAPNEGRVSLHSAVDGSKLVNDPNFASYQGLEVTDVKGFGTDVFGVGDVNGDGDEDYVVSQPNSAGSQDQFLQLISPKDGVLATYEIEHEIYSATAPFSAYNVGDVNGDGQDDVGLSFVDADGGTTDYRGANLILALDASVPTFTPIFFLEGGSAVTGNYNINRILSLNRKATKTKVFDAMVIQDFLYEGGPELCTPEFVALDTLAFTGKKPIAASDPNAVPSGNLPSLEFVGCLQDGGKAKMLIKNIQLNADENALPVVGSFMLAPPDNISKGDFSTSAGCLTTWATLEQEAKKVWKIVKVVKPDPNLGANLGSIEFFKNGLAAGSGVVFGLIHNLETDEVSCTNILEYNLQ